MNPEDINNIMRDLEYLRYLESLINECSHNSGQENVQECANTSATVNPPRSEGRISNNEGGQQEAVPSNTHHTDNIDLPRCSANVDASISNPALNDSVNPLTLLDETQDAAVIIAEAGPENMFSLFFDPNRRVHNNPTEITEADITTLCENIAPLLKLVPIQPGSQTSEFRKAKRATSDSSPILSTEQQILGTNSDNLDPMERVVHEIFKQILAPNSLLMIRGSHHGARKPSSEPNRPNHDNYDHLTVIMAFIVLFFIILKFCY